MRRALRCGTVTSSKLQLGGSCVRFPMGVSHDYNKPYRQSKIVYLKYKAFLLVKMNCVNHSISHLLLM